MDQELRALERRWRTQGDTASAEALLSSACRAREHALVQEVLGASAAAWVERRDHRAAELCLRFVASVDDDARLHHAPLIDRIACAGHDEAKTRYAEWFPPLARTVGSSAAIRHVRAQVAAYARASDPVLLHDGGSGSGYALTAQALHELSLRPVLETVYVGGTGGGLVRHELRSLTPEGGTLYAAYADPGDPAGWLDLALELCRARGARLLISSFRSQPWPAAVSGCTIRIPPLRERLDDLPLLVPALLGRHGLTIRSVPTWLLERLQRYPWPGNVRELDNALQRASALGRPSQGGVLDPVAWEFLDE